MLTLSRATTWLKDIARDHDEIPAFHATYLVLSFVVAAIFSLGYFAILIGVHMALDFVKYRDVYKYNMSLTLKGVLLESLFDIVLFMVALVFAIYFHHTFALTAVSGLARAELTMIRAFGTIVPKIEIFQHVFWVFAHLDTYLHNKSASNLAKPFTSGQRWCLYIIASCSVLIALAFAISYQNIGLLLAIFSKEFSLAL